MMYSKVLFYLCLFIYILFIFTELFFTKITFQNSMQNRLEDLEKRLAQQLVKYDGEKSKPDNFEISKLENQLTRLQEDVKLLSSSEQKKTTDKIISVKKMINGRRFFSIIFLSKIILSIIFQFY